MDYFKLIVGTLLLFSSLLTLLGKRRTLYLSQKGWAERVAALEGGAQERFFEEYRALKAYPPKSTWYHRTRFWLWFNVVMSLLMIVTGIFGMPTVLALMGWHP